VRAENRATAEWRAAIVIAKDRIKNGIQAGTTVEVRTVGGACERCWAG
jgi:hypothetical protein